jgi:hypothetical protein
MMPSYNINMDSLDFAVVLALVFTVGFVACIWARYWVYRVDVVLTMLYLRFWAVEYDWRKRHEREGRVFPAWEGSAVM